MPWDIDFYKRAANPEAKERDGAYRPLFEDGPLAMVEGNLAGLRRFILDQKRNGVSDIGAHLSEHPEQLLYCRGLVKPVRANKEYRRLANILCGNEAADAVPLLLSQTEKSLKTFGEAVLALAEGKLPFEGELSYEGACPGMRIMGLRISIVTGHEDDWSRVLFSFMDLTERKRAERDLLRAKDEKNLLMRELMHRVKNNLSLVASLLNMGSQHLSDKDARQTLVDAQARILSVARIYELLSGSSGADRLDGGVYVGGLLRLLRESYADTASDIRIRTLLESIELEASTCAPIGLIVNELVTNALKYAFPQYRAGLISVELRREGAAIRLRVRDDGVGFPSGFDWKASGGLGFQIVRTLVAQLGGSIEASGRDGVDVSVSLPAQP